MGHVTNWICFPKCHIKSELFFGGNLITENMVPNTEGPKFQNSNVHMCMNDKIVTLGDGYSVTILAW